MENDRRESWFRGDVVYFSRMALVDCNHSLAPAKEFG